MDVNVTGKASFREHAHKYFAFDPIRSDRLLVPLPHLNHQPVEQEAVAKVPA